MKKVNNEFCNATEKSPLFEDIHQINKVMKNFSDSNSSNPIDLDYTGSDVTLNSCPMNFSNLKDDDSTRGLCEIYRKIVVLDYQSIVDAFDQLDSIGYSNFKSGEWGKQQSESVFVPSGLASLFERIDSRYYQDIAKVSLEFCQNLKAKNVSQVIYNFPLFFSNRKDIFFSYSDLIEDYRTFFRRFYGVWGLYADHKKEKQKLLQDTAQEMFSNSIEINEKIYLESSKFGRIRMTSDLCDLNFCRRCIKDIKLFLMALAADVTLGTEYSILRAANVLPAIPSLTKEDRNKKIEKEIKQSKEETTKIVNKQESLLEQKLLIENQIKEWVRKGEQLEAEGKVDEAMYCFDQALELKLQG